MMNSDGPQEVRVDHSDLLEAGCNAPPPVLVTGMHNSGTSILTEIIHKGGVFMENSMDHYESYFFSIFINDQIIMGGKDEWAKTPIMSEDKVLSFADSVGSFARKNWIVSYLMSGYDGKSRWGFKDPRLCVLIPLYLKVFPDAKLVYIDRKTKDIAASLCRRSKKGVGSLDDIGHWKSLAIDYKSRAKKYVKKHNNSYKVRYSKFCNNTEKVTEDLFEFLNIKMNNRAERAYEKVHSERINSYEKYKVNKRNNLYKYYLNIKNRVKEIVMN